MDDVVGLGDPLQVDRDLAVNPEDRLGWNPRGGVFHRGLHAEARHHYGKPIDVACPRWAVAG
ncbi:MAG: hypothetical protein U0S12_10500 [Fimbriimonadales bacterium]